MKDATAIAALAVSVLSLLSGSVLMLRYLPRIARAITLWADMPAKVQANTDAISANTAAVMDIKRAITVSTASSNSNSAVR